MDDPRKPSLDDALTLARGLPVAQQDALAAELIGRVEELRTARLSDRDTAEVQRRLVAPANYASDAEVKAFFARHSITSE